MTKEKYLASVNNSLKMGFFLFYKLPAAWFMGVRVGKCELHRCTATLPYRWTSQNPFKSIYFAAQCAAGEYSTGLLCMTHLSDKPPISMLVTHVEAEFFKKASDKLVFTCEQGAEVAAIIGKALETGEGQSIRMTSVGTLPNGDIASKIYITWPFKRKK